MCHDWDVNFRFRHAEARLRELTALREEIRLARAVRPPGHLRRRLGALLIAAGQRLAEPARDTCGVDAALAGVRKG